MALVCLGLSHRTAPVEVRERHAFPPSSVSEALIALRDYEAVREAAMLSTCGRLEIYAELEDLETGVSQLKQFLTSFRHGSVAYDMESYMYTLLGAEAVQHLLRVATGLDSMLIGEAEILGQVKDAYNRAQHARSLGKTLHALFREALNAGKAARSQTAIGGESVSVATAAIALSKEHVGELQGKNVLLVGAGKMGQTAAKRLKHEGARITIVNRTHERARELVEELGVGEAVDLPSLSEALKDADVVITSTGASHFILRPGNVAESLLTRPERPLFVIDIAVPRDVDPEVARVPGVRVAHIDELGATVDLTLERRRSAVPLVEEIVAEHVRRFIEWHGARLAVPVIALLTQRAESIRSNEVDRLFARCPDLSARERMLITGTSLTIISKLLHSAVAKIRDTLSDDGDESLARARLLDELFDLRTDSPVPPEPFAQPAAIDDD
jgi:glutamyl-tRNA reductase